MEPKNLKRLNILKCNYPITECEFGKDYGKFPACERCKMDRSCRIEHTTKRYGNYNTIRTKLL